MTTSVQGKTSQKPTPVTDWNSFEKVFNDIAGESGEIDTPMKRKKLAEALGGKIGTSFKDPSRLSVATYEVLNENLGLKKDKGFHNIDALNPGVTSLNFKTEVGDHFNFSKFKAKLMEGSDAPPPPAASAGTGAASQSGASTTGGTTPSTTDSVAQSLTDVETAVGLNDEQKTKLNGSLKTDKEKQDLVDVYNALDAKQKIKDLSPENKTKLVDKYLELKGTDAFKKLSVQDKAKALTDYAERIAGSSGHNTGQVEPEKKRNYVLHGEGTISEKILRDINKEMGITDPVKQGEFHLKQFLAYLVRKQKLTQKEADQLGANDGKDKNPELVKKLILDTKYLGGVNGPWGKILERQIIAGSIDNCHDLVEALFSRFKHYETLDKADGTKELFLNLDDFEKEKLLEP